MHQEKSRVWEPYECNGIRIWNRKKLLEHQLFHMSSHAGLQILSGKLYQRKFFFLSAFCSDKYTSLAAFVDPGELHNPLGLWQMRACPLVQKPSAKWLSTYFYRANNFWAAWRTKVRKRWSEGVETQMSLACKPRCSWVQCCQPVTPARCTLKCMYPC